MKTITTYIATTSIPRERLTKRLKLVVKLNKEYGLESLTMKEASKLAMQSHDEVVYEKKPPVTL